MQSLEESYITNIKSHEGIIHKVTQLYTDSPEDKADLYQEILLQGWRGFSLFRKEAQFSTWLYRVGLNTALTYRKNESKRISTTTIEQVDQASEPQTADAHQLYEMIKKLGDVDKMVITLHLDGYKNKEIAEITGMTANNITVKLHRVKAHIIDQYKTVNDGHI